MKTIHAMRATLITTVLALVAWPATSGWAQGALAPQTSSPSPGGAPPAGGMTAVAVAVSVVAVLVILGALVKMLDLKRKRDGEAVVVQAQISDAVLRDPRLFSLPITPTARVPLWKGSPITVEVAGQVPSDDLRQAALHLIEREASHLRSDVRVESRIGVVPTMVRRSA
ncbi:MAG: hypothetical protein DMD96_16235 [Candidatus Rokuibacteriota bacterium]|nr:MAG: hypothetical protein DMD96_16235 [Candidatus Rokubacteria bacterium]